MKQVIILLTLFSSFLGAAQDNSDETPRILIRVELGTAVNIDGVRIEFTEVIEDSRCPANVTCVWEGRARVRVLVTEPGSETDEKIVIFGKVTGNESSDKLLCKRNNNSLMAMQLHPYPQNAGEQLDYVLLVDRETEDH